MNPRTPLAIALLSGIVLAGCRPAETPVAPASEPAASSPAETVERGRYLSVIGGCHDCHTPKTMGPEGPQPDMTRALSGHPESVGAPPAPVLPGPWIGATTADLTAWSGPWGISFAANLTPDEETGYGVIEEAMFVESMRTGRHFGGGRPILPPMPWPNIGTMTDDDLHALYAYLRSIPPIRNKVPDPVPPPAAPPS